MEFVSDLTASWLTSHGAEPSKSKSNSAPLHHLNQARRYKCPGIYASRISNASWRTSRGHSHTATLSRPSTLSPPTRMKSENMGMKPPRPTTGWRSFLAPAITQMASCQSKSEDQVSAPWFPSLRNALRPTRVLNCGSTTVVLHNISNYF